MRACHRAFFKHISACNYRSVLALNGELPDKDFFDMSGLPLIAADGAVNVLDALGIKPQAAVGDLDTAKPELLENIEVVYVPDQNRCDFEKALEYIEKAKLMPAIIVGMSGGYIDHILNNIHIFVANGSVFYAPPIVGHLIKEGEARSFCLPVDTKISLFGMPAAEVSSIGLKWELEHINLAFPSTSSAFNRTSSGEVFIKAHKGTALVLIYLVKIDDCGSRILLS